MDAGPGPTDADRDPARPTAEPDQRPSEPSNEDDSETVAVDLTAAGAALRPVVNTLKDPMILLGLLLIFSFVVRVVWLDLPKKGTIFDEAYYVNAARVILGYDIPEGGKYGDREKFLDPNKEPVSYTHLTLPTKA